MNKNPYKMFAKDKRQYIQRNQYVHSRAAQIVQACKGKKVLHIGACDAPFTQERLDAKSLLFLHIEDVASEQVGIDLDKNAISILSKSGYTNILHKNMNEPWDSDFAPDIIIFGETLEHLMNLQVALDSLARLMHPHTKLMISVPNASSLTRFRQSLQGYNLEHSDHKVSFNYFVLKKLFEANNFIVEEILFTYMLDVPQNNSIFSKIYGQVLQLFPVLANGLLFTVSYKETQ